MLLADHGEVHEFLLEHLLHWLEALSLIRKLPEGIRAITSLESIVSDKETLFKVLYTNIVVSPTEHPLY